MGTERCREQEAYFFMLEIDPQFLGHPVLSLVAVLTEQCINIIDFVSPKACLERTKLQTLDI
jgi:hypothetical protein